MMSAISVASSSANNGTRATIPQVTTKSRRWISSANGGCDNADGQGDHDQADEDRDRGDDASQRGHRNDVAIADRAQRDDCPPHRVGNGAEFLGLRMAFDHMHDAGGDERRPYQDHEAAEQRAALVVKHVQKRAHRRRVARQFEKTHHSKYQQDPQIGRQHERKPKRQDREEVDDAERADHELPSRLAFARVPVRGVLGCHPYAQCVFDGEGDQRDHLDREE